MDARRLIFRATLLAVLAAALLGALSLGRERSLETTDAYATTLVDPMAMGFR